jgi:hypothetical protein
VLSAHFPISICTRESKIIKKEQAHLNISRCALSQRLLGH